VGAAFGWFGPPPVESNAMASSIVHELLEGNISGKFSSILLRKQDFSAWSGLSKCPGSLDMSLTSDSGGNIGKISMELESITSRLYANA
jgi:hypothetical protein